LKRTRPDVLLLAVAVIALATVTARSTTIYVDDLGDGAIGVGTKEEPFRDLQFAIDRALDGDIIRLAPGTYSAEPGTIVEQFCGNCEEHETDVEVTVGFVVLGKAIQIIGDTSGEAVLQTNAGYGVYFDDCHGSILSGVTITGGKRDADEAATDAGVVVRESTVTLRNLKIVDNTDRAEDVVVGIGGVMGREGAEIYIIENTISNNGWDGVALYRGATAVIADNDISDGRGAGIGITWDSSATILRNRISGYWKGIGSFGESRVVASNNAVFDNLGWGIVITGTSWMEAKNNVVARNGNCGFALWSDEATGVFTNNIVVSNGWREEWVCPQVGVWMNGLSENIRMSYNDVWGNSAGEYRDIDDLTGTGGNISLDPAFVDSLDFHLAPDSPCRDAGDPAVLDLDSTPSDMGMFGGPSARLGRDRE
jgi:parallel beta-helix repeat protein